MTGWMGEALRAVVAPVTGAGPWPADRPDAPERAEELEARMRRCGLADEELRELRLLRREIGDEG